MQAHRRCRRLEEAILGGAAGEQLVLRPRVVELEKPRDRESGVLARV